MSLYPIAFVETWHFARLASVSVLILWVKYYIFVVEKQGRLR